MSNYQKLFDDGISWDEDTGLGTLLVKYESNTVESGSTGIGLRVHFDSTSMQVVSQDVQPHGALLIPASPAVDSGDFDNDSGTDSYLGINYVAFTGGWPGSESQDIATITFQKVDGGNNNFEVDYTPSSQPPLYDEFIAEPTTNTVEVDVTAPVITSSGAVTIDENIGADQVIYTATADDSADISEAVTYSLVDNTVYSGTSALGDDVAAATQLISVSGSPVAGAGDQVSLAINYNADTNELPGLGLRIHFDSTMLSVEGMTDVLDKDLIYTDTVSQADTEDFDGDASTDAYVTVAWASLNGDWPNAELPDELLNVLFNVSSDASGSAAIGFSATSTPIGYDFSGVDFDLQVIDSPLSINADTGEVTLSENPDFEARDNYSFSVTATDAAGNVSDAQAVTVAVSDLDEVAPVVTSGAAAAAIDENSGANQVIYTAAADDSADVSGGVTFSLAEGSDTALSIDAGSGEVTLTESPDYEIQSQYNFTVVATDAAGNASEQAVSFNVNDLLDTAPEFTSSGTASIDENSGSQQIVYTASSDENVVYSLVDNTVYPNAADQDSQLELLDATSMISASGALVAEGGDQVALAINYNAVDNQLPGLGLRIHYDSSALSVAGVADVLEQDLIYTDANPQADSSDLDANSSTDAYITVAWASLGGDWPGTDLPDQLLTVLFDVAPGATGSAAVDFSATSTPIGYDFAGEGYGIEIVESPLSINPTTGEVTLLDNPDYESLDSYDFTVTATDTSGNTADQAVTLSVNNVDEVAPTVTSDATLAIDENIGADQVIYTATADDSADISEAVTYSLVDNTVYSGTSALGDDVAAATQLISVSGSPVAGAGDQVSLAINYNADTNELPGLGLRIHFDSTMLSVEGMTDVLDKDLIYTDTVSQADTEDFDGDASTDAYVTVAWASLNGDWPNAELPDELLNVLFNVSSDASGSAAIGFSATSTPIGYDFSGVDFDLQVIDSPLSINADTGEVTLSENPDFEARDNYSFSVTATDAAGNVSGAQAVTVAVSDLDEVAPVVTSGAAAAAIDENSGAGSGYLHRRSG